MLVAAAVTLAAGGARSARAQEPEVPRVTASWSSSPISEVLLAFAAYADRSIVVAPSVSGTVTATVRDQRWDVALRAILTAHGLVAVEDQSGIIRVGGLEDVSAMEGTELLLIRLYRIRYTPVAELGPALQLVLSERGAMSVAESTNTLIVTDVARVHVVLAGLRR